jgi:hypothetical protein
MNQPIYLNELLQRTLPIRDCLDDQRDFIYRCIQRGGPDKYRWHEVNESVNQGNKLRFTMTRENRMWEKRIWNHSQVSIDNQLLCTKTSKKEVEVVPNSTQ